MENNNDTKNIIASSQSVKDKLADLRKETMERFPDLAGILEKLKIEDKGSSAPGGLAATDGTDIMVNAEEILKMGGQASKIIAHELAHIARNDMSKSGSGSVETERGTIDIWNIVSDIYVNNKIGLHDGLHLDEADSVTEDQMCDIIRSSLEDPKVDKADFWAAVWGDGEKFRGLVDRYEQRKKQKEQGLDDLDKSPDEQGKENAGQQENIRPQNAPEPEMGM